MYKFRKDLISGIQHLSSFRIIYVRKNLRSQNLMFTKISMHFHLANVCSKCPSAKGVSAEKHFDLVLNNASPHLVTGYSILYKKQFYSEKIFMDAPLAWPMATCS